MSLSHRERVLRALRHQEPDRVPLDLGSTRNSSIHVTAYQEMKAHFGVEAADSIAHKYMQVVRVHEPVLKALDIDFRGVWAGSPDSAPDIPVGEDGYRDEYGVTRRKPPGLMYYDLVESPLAGQISVHDIVNYPLPDPADPGWVRGVRDQLLHYRENTDYAVVLGLPSMFVHATQFLRGFEDWFTDLAADRRLAAALFDRAVEHSTAVATELLKAGGDLADVVATSDDLGFQGGPMISPEMYRTLFKPRHKRYLDAVRENTDAPIHLHSCGSIYSLLDDFIEMGVDAIHPVQVAAKDMDSGMLGPEFGSRLGFWGGVDSQQVLPYGSPGEVRAEVRRLISDLAPGGGYVLSAVHNIQNGVPLGNVLAMYEAGKEYGRYPISPG